MEHDSGVALRRVAIVLSSLPETTVARLLSGFGDEQQHAVRAAIRQLSDVDALERRRVLDAFAESVRLGKSPLASENDAAEIVLSRAARQHREVPSALRERSPVSATAPLAFLSEVDDDVLTAEIGHEHPQTIAIVLASLAPSQAARILQRLEVATRQETMRRLSKLDAPPPEVVQEIGSQLKQKLLAHGARLGAPAGGSRAAGRVGQDVLRSILAELPAAEEPPRHTAAQTTAPDHVDASTVGAGRNSDPVGWRLVSREETVPKESAPAAHRQRRPEHRGEAPAADLTAAIHARLVALPTERLRQALASVETRQSLLALCGLPSAVAENVLASLPRRQARQVRRQLAELGTIQLREIDRAKAAVAAAADRLDRDLNGEVTSAAGHAVRPGTLMAA